MQGDELEQQQKIQDSKDRSGVGPQKGKKANRVHYDPVSVVKIDYMGGNKDSRRALQDGSDLAWYLELTSSIAKMESKHKNIYSYWIDSQGHCSSGLYYPFQEIGKDFVSWTSPIVEDRRGLLDRQAGSRPVAALGRDMCNETTECDGMDRNWPWLGLRIGWEGC